MNAPSNLERMLARGCSVSINPVSTSGNPYPGGHNSMTLEWQSLDSVGERCAD